MATTALLCTRCRVADLSQWLLSRHFSPLMGGENPHFSAGSDSHISCVWRASEMTLVVVHEQCCWDIRTSVGAITGPLSLASVDGGESGRRGMEYEALLSINFSENTSCSLLCAFTLASECTACYCTSLDREYS